MTPQKLKIYKKQLEIFKRESLQKKVEKNSTEQSNIKTTRSMSTEEKLPMAKEIPVLEQYKLLKLKEEQERLETLKPNISNRSKFKTETTTGPNASPVLEQYKILKKEEQQGSIKKIETKLIPQKKDVKSIKTEKKISVLEKYELIKSRKVQAEQFNLRIDSLKNIETDPHFFSDSKASLDLEKIENIKNNGVEKPVENKEVITKETLSPPEPTQAAQPAASTLAYNESNAAQKTKSSLAANSLQKEQNNPPVYKKWIEKYSNLKIF